MMVWMVFMWSWCGLVWDWRVEWVLRRSMTLRLGAAGCKLKARVRRDVELLPEPGLLLPAPVSASPKPEAHVHLAAEMPRVRV